MGKKGKSWKPLGALPDPRWYQSAASRLDNVRDDLARTGSSDGQGSSDPPRGDVESTATSSRGVFESLAERRATEVKARGQPADAAEELGALRHGRTSPANFNLQRHAVMVSGRPVVVHI